MISNPGPSGPAQTYRVVTPNDGADLPRGVCRGLFVTGAGTLTVVAVDGQEVQFASLDCQYHPINAARVKSTGTGATGIIALY